MGKIATELADMVIITNDNPRDENPKIIRSEIINGCDKSKILEIEDRKMAICKSIDLMQDNDILIIAGKGHENTQIIADKIFYSDDYEIALDYLKQIAST